MKNLTSLLTTFGWPEEHLDKKGSMNWTRTTEKNDLTETTDKDTPIALTASIITSSDTLTIRCRAVSIEALKPLMEVSMNIHPDESLSIKRCVILGKDAVKDIDSVIDEFKKQVDVLGRPVFQSFSTRKKQKSKLTQ